MGEDDTRVIGYVAELSPLEVVCTDVDACVVSGSAEAMQQYLTQVQRKAGQHAVVRKARLGNILRGLRLGAGYAFDRESYERFFPLAQKAGLAVERADFEQGDAMGRRFFTVRLELSEPKRRQRPNPVA